MKKYQTVIASLFTFLFILVLCGILLMALKPSAEYIEPLFSNGLVPLEKDGKWGYTNEKGNIKIDFKFDDASKFVNGHAIVGIDNEYYAINELGRKIFKKTYSYLTIDPKTNLIWFEKEDKIGLMSLAELVLAPPQYDDFNYFSEGFASVRVGDKFGYINERGKLMISLNYDLASKYSEGLAFVKVNERYGYIDKECNYVIEPVYTEATPFYKGLSVVRNSQTNQYQVIDMRGRIIFSGYNYIERSKTRFIVKKGIYYYLLDSKGKSITSDTYLELHGMGINFDSFYVRTTKDEYSIIDRNGKAIFSNLNPEDEWFFDYYNENQYLVKYNGNLITVISKATGEITIEGDFITEIFDRLAIVERNEMYGVVDFNNNIIIPFDYDKLTFFSDGYLLVNKDDLEGIINRSGKVIVEPLYENVYNLVR